MQLSAYIKIVLIFILSMFFSVPSMAEAYHYFNNKVQILTEELNKKNLEHDELFLIISEGLLLRNQLNQCVANQEKKLNDLNQLLLDQNVEVELEKEQKIKANLEVQKKEILTNVGRCKLLLYQVHELLVRAHDLKGDKFLFKLFQKVPRPSAIDLGFYSQQSEDSQFFIQHAIFLSVLALIGFIGAFLLYKINIKLTSRFSWLNVVQKNLAIWFPFGMVLGYLSVALPQASVLKPIFFQLLILTNLFFLIKICLMLTVENKLWMRSKEIKLFFDAGILLLSVALIISVPLRSKAGFFISPFFSHFRFVLFIVWIWLYVESLDWYQSRFKTNVKKILIMLTGILSFYFLQFCVQTLYDYRIISSSAAYVYKALYIALFNLMLCSVIWVVIKNKKIILKTLSNSYLNAFILSVIYFISLNKRML